ncbi:MAG: T9SS type A sorting domain-containing protein [Candidatus Krumholzibacteria bacterium]|nr:T9SS type A sorting domain-containing protein [Candidatus Krumholzibacteria bacterium]
MKFWTLILCLVPLAISATELEWVSWPDASDIRSFSFDGSRLWAAGRGGALSLNPDSGEVEFLRASDGLPLNDLNAVLALSQDEIWFATNGEGLARYRPADEEVWKRFQVFPQAITSDRLLCLEEGPQGRVWYGSDAGFGVMEGVVPGEIWDAWEGLGNEEVRCLEFEGDSLWVGTADGLFLLPPGGVLEEDAGVPESAILDLIFGDRLYLLAEGNVHFLNDNGDWQTLADPLSGHSARAFFWNQDKLYVSWRSSSETGKLLAWNPGTESWEDLSSGLPEVLDGNYARPVLSALHVDDGGNAWLGGQVYRGMGPGILWRKEGLWQRLSLQEGPLSPETTALSFGASGRWITGSKGGAAWYDGEWHWIPMQDEWSNAPAWSLDCMEDSEGWAWFSRFGTSTLRIHLDSGDWEMLEAGAGSIASHAVIRMGEDSSGNRWFALDGFGLSVFTPESEWLHFTGVNAGLPGDIIDGLAFPAPGEVALLVRGLGPCIWDTGGTIDFFLDDTWYAPGNGISDPQGRIITDTTGFDLDARSGEDCLWLGQSDGLLLLESWGGGWTVSDYLNKKTFLRDGLLHAQVNAVAAGPGRSAWLATAGGLSRVELDAEAGLWSIDNYTSEAGREAAGKDLFGPDVLAPLSGLDVYRVALHPDADRLFLGMKDAGLLELILHPDSAPVDQSLTTVYLYPNPITGESALSFGGISANLDVEIFNLEGQLVSRTEDVAPGEDLWPGLETRFGNRALSGRYFLRLKQGSSSQLRKVVLLR